MIPPYPPEPRYGDAWKNLKDAMYQKIGKGMLNCYGIEAVKYEWRGPWEGPILHYKGGTPSIKTTLKMR